jgi:MoaA/NifB/PqqE/SkfB family radical SAM enzyme
MRLINRPVLCNYYVTYRCNAKCGFCDIWEKPSPYITLENVRENLADLKRLGVNVIDFTGGEPLLHRDLHHFLRLAKEMGFLTTVTTNALLYPKYGELLRGLIDMLHFSLDSPVREEHNASRGVNCFDHVMRSIELAKSWGEKPDILFTVTGKNVQQIRQVYEEISLPNKLMLILNPVFEYNELGESLDEETLSVMESWGRKKMVYLNAAFIDLRRNGGNQVDSPVCKAATTSLVISPENKLILPCYHLGVREMDIKGNLYDVYYSEQAEEIKRQEGRLPGCQGCVINCYMQPSFAVELSRYWFRALPSTVKYAWEKRMWMSATVAADP